MPSRESKESVKRRYARGQLFRWAAVIVVSTLILVCFQEGLRNPPRELDFTNRTQLPRVMSIFGCVGATKRSRVAWLTYHCCCAALLTIPVTFVLGAMLLVIGHTYIFALCIHDSLALSAIEDFLSSKVVNPVPSFMVVILCMCALYHLRPLYNFTDPNGKVKYAGKSLLDLDISRLH